VAWLRPSSFCNLGCVLDRLAIEVAFAVAAAVSTFLVVSYGRLFLGLRSAILLLSVPQVLYLVLFSATFFLEGYTGLAVTVGAVLTLFVIMQMTGRIRWDEAFQAKAKGSS
jgi:hypothetical protein